MQRLGLARYPPRRRERPAEAGPQQLGPGRGRRHDPLHRRLSALSRERLQDLHHGRGRASTGPSRYEDLEPYYDQIEKEIAVSGPALLSRGGPFAGPTRTRSGTASAPTPGVPAGAARRWASESVVAPLAILSAPFDGRPPCINRGFCNQGCMPNSKFSTLIHHIPKAIAAGAEVLSDCMVTQLEVDGHGRRGRASCSSTTGRSTGSGPGTSFLCNFVVETPAALAPVHRRRSFPTASPTAAAWWANASCPTASHDMYALFDEEIRLYKGTPVLATTQEFYETDPAGALPGGTRCTPTAPGRWSSPAGSPGGHLGETSCGTPCGTTTTSAG